MSQSVEIGDLFKQFDSSFQETYWNLKVHDYCYIGWNDKGHVWSWYSDDTDFTREIERGYLRDWEKLT